MHIRRRPAFKLSNLSPEIVSRLRKDLSFLHPSSIASDYGVAHADHCNMSDCETEFSRIPKSIWFYLSTRAITDAQMHTDNRHLHCQICQQIIVKAAERS